MYSLMFVVVFVSIPHRATIDFMDDNLLCSFIWPLQLFSFLCAFGLVILIANRFKRVNTGKSQKEHLNFPLSIVPIVAFILTLPTLIIDQAVQSTHITELIANSNSDENKFCFFNSSIMGTVVNYICLQLPSLFAIVYNIHAYRMGVDALKTSSPEVCTVLMSEEACLCVSYISASECSMCCISFD